MMKIKIKQILSVLALVFLVLPGASWAQDKDENEKDGGKKKDPGP